MFRPEQPPPREALLTLDVQALLCNRVLGGCGVGNRVASPTPQLVGALGSEQFGLSSSSSGPSLSSSANGNDRCGRGHQGVLPVVVWRTWLKGPCTVPGPNVGFEPNCPCIACRMPLNDVLVGRKPRSAGQQPASKPCVVERPIGAVANGLSSSSSPPGETPRGGAVASNRLPTNSAFQPHGSQAFRRERTVTSLSTVLTLRGTARRRAAERSNLMTRVPQRPLQHRRIGRS